MLTNEWFTLSPLYMLHYKYYFISIIVHNSPPIRNNGLWQVIGCKEALNGKNTAVILNILICDYFVLRWCPRTHTKMWGLINMGTGSLCEKWKIIHLAPWSAFCVGQFLTMTYHTVFYGILWQAFFQRGQLQF